MGNVPTGGKRRNSTEENTGNRELQYLGQNMPATQAGPASKKLIIKPTQDVYEVDAISKILAEADVSDIAEKLNEARMTDNAIGNGMNSGENDNKTIPTVFKWEGGGKEVFLSGSFNNWRAKIPMIKSKHNFYTIVELPKGEHQYKFIVDGVWKFDQRQQLMSNDLGIQNNIISVKKSDFDVLEALCDDIANSKSSGGSINPSSRATPTISNKVLGGVSNRFENSSSPPGSYNQTIPNKTTEIGVEKSATPPLLPPQLLQVILNKETGVHCDPNLLPQPNHVMINHMYALSIKDGVIVLSAIARYRQKFVSTVMYKPI